VTKISAKALSSFSPHELNFAGIQERMPGNSVVGENTSNGEKLFTHDNLNTPH
jgi:hypothetical protein